MCLSCRHTAIAILVTFVKDIVEGVLFHQINFGVVPSYDESEVLGLDKPFSLALSLGPVGGWIRHQHEGLAEASLRQISGLSKAHIAANDHQDRHVLDSRFSGELHSSGCRCRIRLVDNLAIDRLHLIMRRGHLVDENLLDSGSIGDSVSVEKDHGRRLAVERGYRGTVVLEGRVEGLDKVGCRCRLI